MVYQHCLFQHSSELAHSTGDTYWNTNDNFSLLDLNSSKALLQILKYSLRNIYWRLPLVWLFFSYRITSPNTPTLAPMAPLSSKAVLTFGERKQLLEELSHRKSNGQSCDQCTMDLWCMTSFKLGEPPSQPAISKMIKKSTVLSSTPYTDSYLNSGRSMHSHGIIISLMDQPSVLQSNCN